MMPSASDSPYIRACVLSGFAELAKSKGGDPADMLTRAGIDPDVLCAPKMLIAFENFAVLLDLASRELDAPSFGLEWAMSIPPHFPNAGPMLILREGAATVNEWLGRWTDYWRPEVSGVTLAMAVDEFSGIATLRLAPRRGTAMSRQLVEYIFGAIIRLARAVLPDSEINPVGVRFSHAGSQDTDLHDRFFRCPIEFGAAHHEIVFDGAILAGPLRDNAAPLAPIMDRFLRYRIGLLSRYNPSVSMSTALAIRVVLGADVCSKDFIARSLRNSPRKLQRLLAQEGTTYEDILDAVRKCTAGQLLTQTSAPISTIARMLEFASPAAMTLAVRRWTGMTPSAFRAIPHALDRISAAGGPGIGAAGSGLPL